jgi:hypothetical protein
MKALGAEAPRSTRVYFTGGASAVLLGWRATTIDVDIKIVPECDEILRAIARVKESLEINVELASPGDFIPELPGWESRSPFVATEARVSFYHYDFYAQCLAKIERSHMRDVEDVREMIARGLIEPDRALRFFDEMEPKLYRYPAIDPRAFRRAVEEMMKRSS